MNLKFYVFAVLLLGFCHFRSTGQQIAPSIIPKPSQIELTKGSFNLSGDTKLYTNTIPSNAASFFAALIKQSTGYKLSVSKATSNAVNKGIYLFVDKNFADTVRGAYSLEVTTNTVVARAADDIGLFYAAQTIRQLLPATIEGTKKVANARWEIPALKINDTPRFQWRGYMLDVSRTFYGVDVIKKYLDILALYKLNVFHFHLTDDQGWRVEIKKHPELTSAKATTFGPTSNQPKERSGYYTQSHIKEIVSYASERNIDIVPEIDVPGHNWPIVITNPQLGTNDMLKPDYVISFIDSYSHWGFQYTPNPLDPTKEEVYTFLG